MAQNGHPLNGPFMGRFFDVYCSSVIFLLNFSLSFNMTMLSGYPNSTEDKDTSNETNNTITRQCSPQALSAERAALPYFSYTLTHAQKTPTYPRDRVAQLRSHKHVLLLYYFTAVSTRCSQFFCSLLYLPHDGTDEYYALLR